MNFRSLLESVRFGGVILIALMGLVLLTEGAKSTHSYSLVPKPRTKPREIRGLKLRPQSLSTAIGFGKRESSFRSGDVDDRHTSTLTSLQQDIPQRFPLFWYLRYLTNNSALANKIQRQYLTDDRHADGDGDGDADGDDDDDDNPRLSATHRYKKNSDIDDSYYL